MNIHETENSVKFRINALFLSFSKFICTFWQNNLIKLYHQLPEQKVATCTLYRHILMPVQALAFNIVVDIIIDVVDEEMINLLESRHLVLAVIFEVCS